MKNLVAIVVFLCTHLYGADTSEVVFEQTVYCESTNRELAECFNPSLGVKGKVKACIALLKYTPGSRLTLRRGAQKFILYNNEYYMNEYLNDVVNCISNDCKQLKLYCDGPPGSSIIRPMTKEEKEELRESMQDLRKDMQVLEENLERLKKECEQWSLNLQKRAANIAKKRLHCAPGGLKSRIARRQTQKLIED